MKEPRRFRWGFVALGVVLAALVIWLWLASHKPVKAPPPPGVPVTVATVTAADVPLSVTALGAALAWQGVTINAQVGGRLLYVAPEGADVAKGALIAEIDSAAYTAVLTQAQGALKRDTALLDEARINLARYKTLAAQDSIAHQTLEDQAAVVRQNEGTVMIDEGQVAAAQVNVNYCRIVSPVAGRVGVRLIDAGNIVTPAAGAAVSSTATGSAAVASSGIVTINQVTPIAVTFTVPQGDFQRLSDVSGGFNRPLTAQALSQETGAVLGQGELLVADNHVDPTTGTVELKARFPNPSRLLWPGQFVNVRLTLQTLSHATTVPAAAVTRGPSGSLVYVVGPGNKVAARPVTVLTTQDSVAVIKTGLRPGETVVTDGQMLLRPGTVVAVRRPGPAKKPAA